jgi:TonB-dependent SusC/RagA subfamily outer membrane receptor
VPIQSGYFARNASNNVLKFLQDRVGGVRITQNSGAPGGAMTVRIRGVGSFNYLDPLFVVDGVPVKSIEFLNPDDIESVTVLRDASACVIYGSRGANGVFLVTTKNAKIGINSITYNTSVGIQQPWRKPSLCNAEQWAILYNEARRTANLSVYPELEDPSTLGKGTDWFGELLKRNALIQQQNVSVERGSDKFKYFLSAGYFSQEGSIKGSELDKITCRFNTENKVASWISLGNNFGIAHCNADFIDESKIILIQLPHQIIPLKIA